MKSHVMAGKKCVLFQKLSLKVICWPVAAAGRIFEGIKRGPGQEKEGVKQDMDSEGN